MNSVLNLLHRPWKTGLVTLLEALLLYCYFLLSMNYKKILENESSLERIRHIDRWTYISVFVKVKSNLSGMERTSYMFSYDNELIL